MLHLAETMNGTAALSDIFYGVTLKNLPHYRIGTLSVQGSHTR